MFYLPSNEIWNYTIEQIWEMYNEDPKRFDWVAVPNTRQFHIVNMAGQNLFPYDCTEVMATANMGYADDGTEEYMEAYAHKMLKNVYFNDARDHEAATAGPDVLPFLQDTLYTLQNLTTAVQNKITDLSMPM